MQYRWMHCCLLMLVALALVSATGDAKVSRYLSGEVAGFTNGGRPFTIAWEVVPYDGRKVDESDRWRFLDPPAYVLKKLRITLDEQAVSIPFDAIPRYLQSVRLLARLLRHGRRRHRFTT